MTQGISVIIPCYNDGRYLMDAIESVRAQNAKIPVKIIVVDDGSRDPLTQTLISALENSNVHPDIQVIRQNKQGACVARNRGMQATQDEFVFCLDADDKLVTDVELIANGNGYLDRAVAMLKADPSMALVYCKSKIFDAVDCIFSVKTRYDEKKVLSQHSIGGYPIFRRQDALAMGGFNPDLPCGQDWDFNIGLINHHHMKSGGQQVNVGFIDDPLFCYRKRQDNSNISANRKMTVEQMLRVIVQRHPQIFRKHYAEQGDELIQQLLKDRHRILVGQAVAVFKECALHPFRSMQEGTFQLAMMEAPRVKRSLLSFFRISAAEPLAVGEQPHPETPDLTL